MEKRKIVKKGKLSKVVDLPIHLVAPEYQLKMTATLSPDQKSFRLYVNGTPFYSLPYQYCPYEDEFAATNERLDAEEIKLN